MYYDIMPGGTIMDHRIIKGVGGDVHFSNGDNAEQVDSEIEQFVIQTTVG